MILRSLGIVLGSGGQRIRNENEADERSDGERLHTHASSSRLRQGFGGQANPPGLRRGKQM